MRTVSAVVLGAILLFWTSTAPGLEDLPAAAQEVLKQYEEESAAIEKRIGSEIQKKRDKTTAELKKIQDGFCKEAKLDEAVAVRDVIRTLQAGGNVAPGAELPAAVQEMLKQFEQEEAEVYEKAEADTKKNKGKTVAELQKIQDTFCRDAKLDEAVAVRDLLRGILDVRKAALADPGNLNHTEADIGKVFYYNVTGAAAGGAIYGTDVFLSGSVLAAAAVHSGVLKDGQRGVVKVTILPGQQTYTATTRNGVASNAAGAGTVSFKVERTYGFLTSSSTKVLPDPGMLTAYRGQNGKTFLFEVTGTTDRSVAGTDIYTDDSGLSTAAVHAGALRSGQTAIVRVTILAGQETYTGSTRHGVTTIQSTAYPGSFKVERASGRGKRRAQLTDEK
jgi:LCCL domain